MPRIERTPLAEAGLLAIGRYVAEQSQSENIALQLLDAIDEKCVLLSRHMHAGEARPDLGREIRVSPVGNHLIFYRPLDDGIEIIRVLQGARDIPAVFRRREP